MQRKPWTIWQLKSTRYWMTGRLTTDLLSTCSDCLSKGTQMHNSSYTITVGSMVILTTTPSSENRSILRFHGEYNWRKMGTCCRWIFTVYSHNVIYICFHSLEENFWDVKLVIACIRCMNLMYLDIYIYLQIILLYNNI